MPRGEITGRVKRLVVEKRLGRKRLGAETTKERNDWRERNDPES